MAKNITSVVWEAGDLPDGLSIDASTGVISGTPDVQPGTYTPTVTVTTNYGTDSKQLTINVATPESWLPIIDDNQSINITAGEAMTAYTVTGTNVTLTKSSDEGAGGDYIPKNKADCRSCVILCDMSNFCMIASL